MKFFSNDAKENSDGPDYDREQGGDVVTSEPVAVPQQRAGSPWSDTPGSPDSELATQERRDGTNDEWASSTTDEPVSTTYGPDGTVSESTDRTDADTDEDREHDGVKDEDARVEERADEDEAIRDEGSFDSPEAVDPATGDSLDKSDSFVESDKSEAAVDAERESHHEDVAVVEARDEETLKDDGSFDGPEAVDPTTGHSLDETVGEHRADEDRVEEDRLEEERADEDRDEAEAVPVVDAAPVEETTPEQTEAVPVATADETPADETPADEPVAVAATPGSVPEPAVDRLFPAGDSFAERFREIQLVFVDNPKEATAQAAGLVTEAVDAITTALNEQKNALAAGSDDTEQLRVELRGYRDMLNRLTAL